MGSILSPSSLPAVSISEPASEWLKGAGLELAAQDVPLVHGQAAANHQEQGHKVEHGCIAQFHLDSLFKVLYLKLCKALNTAQQSSF